MHVLQEVTKCMHHGESIIKIASSFYFVHHKNMVLDLAKDLDKMNHIHSVGVVDDNSQVIGILVRRELFDLLGKPYGQDILKHKTVDSLMRQTIKFNYERNIFSISEEIADNLVRRKIEYFMLTNENNEFAGIFASIDMMIYLTMITQKDINLARSLQNNIVKENTLVQRDNFAIVGASRMAKGVGGDFYDIHNYKPDRWLLSICDVSGKGVSASLLTTSISGIYHAYDFRGNIARLIQKINEYIFHSFEMQKFLTGIFIDFQESSGELTIYDMGHSYLFLFSKGNFYRLKTSTFNRPLGIEQIINPVGNKFKLSNGDLLICITDGIVEQVNSKGFEFGEKRFASIIKEYRSQGVEAVKNALLDSLYAYRGKQPQHDDMTMVMVEYKGCSNL